jgi:hypothetical protein
MRPLPTLFFAIQRNAKSLAKSFLYRYYPDAIFVLRAWRNRRDFRRLFFFRQSQMKSKIYGNGSPAVLSGPFAGMKYLNEVCWGPIEPKWLGSYEQELHPIIASILNSNYAQVLDLGSAEGYYAIGLAMKLPKARVCSYDVDPWARAQQRRLAALNGVKNIGIGKLCTPHDLQSNLSDRSLLICDIEGGEYELLDPAKISALLKCDILVELHDRFDMGVTIKSGAQELTRRFSASHKITEVKSAPRNGSSGPCLGRLTDEELVMCMNEHRSMAEQVWLWLEVLPAKPLTT